MKGMFITLIVCCIMLHLSGVCIASDKTYIFVQSTSAPPNRNALIILSPFVERCNHEKIGEISVTLEEWEGSNVSSTEEILKRLMRKAVLRGANAITKLEIGSSVIVGSSHQDVVVERRHIIYGKAMAIKILPKKTKN